MRMLPILLFIAVLAAPARSQQTLVETIEVRVANIDVVVRDRSGNPVTGLTKDDFEIYDDKVPQKITNFYEIRRGEDAGAATTAETEAAPVELRQRRIVLFFDAASLTPSRRKAVIDSVVKFIDNRMRPEDQAMLVAWRLGLRIVTPFTSDKDALKRGLDEVARYGPAGDLTQASLANLRRDINSLVDEAAEEQGRTNPLITWNEAYNDARIKVGRYGEQVIVQQARLLDDVNRVAEAMAGLEGKKILVFVGEQFPQHPGAELYRYIDNLFGPHMDLRNQLDLEATTGITGNSMANSIEEFARAASANGVTIYAIGAESGEADLSSETTGNPDYAYTFARDANTASALQSVAEITGGVAITRTSNFDLAFDTITRDLSSYYSIGYRPAGEGARQHKIVVRTKNKAYTVRARQTFVTKTTDDQMTDRAVANLYVDPARNDWPLAIQTGTPEIDKGTFVIPLVVAIPSQDITLLPGENDTVVGNLTLYMVVGSGDGATSTVLRRPEPIKISKTQEPLARAKPMLFRTKIRVNPGESTLSVAVIDQLSGSTGFGRTKIVAR